MRRAVRVHVLQGLRQLLQHGLAPGHVGGLRLEPLAQVAALVEGELQVGDGRVARLLEDCLQRGNVRVTQPAQEADLLLCASDGRCARSAFELTRVVKPRLA